MRSILVPTDFSKCANNAMNYALELAQRTGASVTALYVVFPNEGIDNSTYSAFFIDDYVEERLKSMQKWVKRFSGSPHFQGITINVDCKIGFPISTIDETAQSIGASLIVMGTTGASGLRGIFLGSTAAGVVSTSKRPILVVLSKASFRNHARFALATDFNFGVGKDSLQLMREFLNLQHTGLDIVHVLSKPDAQVSPQKENTFSEKLGTIPHDYHYIHDKNVPQAIHNFIEARDCNGLIAIAHEHSLLKRLFTPSISRSLAQRTHVPLLILHDK